MNRRKSCEVSFIFILLIFFFQRYTITQEFFRPHRTEEPPRIDGILDDPVCQNAPSVSEFKSFIPDFGREPSEKTIAYMAYDSENLYFAFKCYDKQPDRIKTAVAKRDSTRADESVSTWIPSTISSFSMPSMSILWVFKQTAATAAGRRKKYSTMQPGEAD